MPLNPETIAKIKNFDDLLAILRDDLNWPLVTEAELDELSFAYDGSELSLSPKTERQLSGGIVQGLAPMVENQPWSVFFVRFDQPKLYVSALREVLRGLVKQSASRPAYQPKDLLFICATKDFEQFTLAHFQTREGGQLPVLETFGWKRGDSHVRTLCEHNLSALKWQDDFESDAAKWREEWRKAFDVSVVTQKFFEEYETHFRAVESAVKGFESPQGAKPDVIAECQAKHNAWTQKLFNRLLFVAFMQKKGWMTPPETASVGHDYLQSLWHDYKARQKETGDTSFFNTRLKPLFAALNTRNATLSYLVGVVPYLNGGLFDTEEDRRLDPADLSVPDNVIEEILFTLFARYNFTAQESTPLDVQVAVDPEMLGKVFEKLILQRDRAAKGSFYTPRTVVTFMCREALKRFLGDQYAPLIERGSTEGISFDEAVLLLDKLYKLRVVDPACGSGAYLLGMLHELFALNKTLDTRAKRATARDDYRRKLDIIQRNLYGVDRDAFAVQIARLRLWLSLVVEFDTSGGEKPEPLPNLDFKIEIGDSLTAPAPSPEQLALYRDQIVACDKLKREFGNYHNGGREDKRREIEALRTEISQWLRAKANGSAQNQDEDEPFDWLVRFGEVFLPEVGVSVTLDGRMGELDKASRQPALAAPAEEKPGGFDIVLANPPYGSDIAENVRWLYFNKASEGSQSKEPYGLFIARGLQLLRPGGCLCFIVSNTWRTLKSHKPLRKRLATQTRVEHFLDLPRWIFEATVDTGILTVVNEVPDEEHQLIAGDLSPLQKDDWNGLEANLEAVAAHGPDAQTLDYARYTYPQKLIGTYDNFSFFIGSPRLYALMSDSRFQKLSDVAEVKVGLQTGDNHYYLRQRADVRGTYEILDEKKLLTEKEIAKLSKDEKENGVDPKKYGGRHFVPYDKGGESDAQGGWLPNYNVPTNYFIDWSKKAVKRIKTLTTKAKKEYWKEFDKIKKGDEDRIPSRFQNSDFYFFRGVTFSRTGEYAPTFRLGNASAFDTEGSLIYSEKASINALLGLSASRAMRYLLNNFVNHSVHVQVDDIKEELIPEPEKTDFSAIEKLVAQIIEKQKAEPRYAYYDAEQVEIDKLVYALYGLTPEDIREVELWYCRRYGKLAAAQGVTKRALQDYADWLERARVLREKPYRYWSRHPWLAEIGRGEGHQIEFKRQFAFADLKVLEAVAALLNADGGTVFVGVTDAGDPIGLETFDLKQPDTNTTDKFERKLRDTLRTRLNLSPLGPSIQIDLEPIEGVTIAHIAVQAWTGKTPIYIDSNVLVVRDGNQKHTLTGANAANWIADRAKKIGL